MIRLWTLGKIDEHHCIIPTAANIQKLRDILSSALKDNDGKPFDLIWGPELSVSEVQVGETFEHYVVEDMKTDDENLYIHAKKIK